MDRIRITLVKSPIGYKADQKDTVRGLGLRKLHQTVEHNATGQILGMVNKVRHLVKVDIVPGG
ncbi:MAG TPA: 50S ribosomal protein L30 [candidate division Zixibacteria bacterium]|nr:50S ribosomal protein L30 [candidate division Zixibacteria bacterium]